LHGGQWELNKGLVVTIALDALNWAQLDVTDVIRRAQGVSQRMTCLIADLQMPGQGGLELQEALRSRGCQYG
jgi:FixJ family two-component response regulator